MFHPLTTNTKSLHWFVCHIRVRRYRQTLHTAASYKTKHTPCTEVRRMCQIYRPTFQSARFASLSEHCAELPSPLSGTLRHIAVSWHSVAAMAWSQLTKTQVQTKWAQWIEHALRRLSVADENVSSLPPPKLKFGGSFHTRRNCVVMSPGILATRTMVPQWWAQLLLAARRHEICMPSFTKPNTNITSSQEALTINDTWNSEWCLARLFPTKASK